MDDAGFLFGGYRLDPVSGMLLDPDGQEVRLRPKPFALLSYLLNNPGRLLGRDELMQALWPDVAVTDDSLTQCISDLRRAFGEHAAAILRTVPRRGYMLAAEVQRTAQATPPQVAPAAAEPTRRSTAQSLALIRRDTVRVLPVRTIPGDAIGMQLAPLLGSDLVTELLRFEDLRVVEGPDAGDARGFAVHAALHAAGPMLRATIRVEDVATGTFFWADRMEWPVEQAAALPVTAITSLAGAIDLQIGRKSLRRAQQRPIEDLSARELTLIGCDLHQHGTQDDTDRAREMFRRAAALDPGYAAAPAWHAFTLMRIVTHAWSGQLREEAVAESVRLARRAVELAPDSALSLAALAFSLALGERWEEALETARLSLRCSRTADFGTRTASSEVLAAGGAPQEAVDALRATLALDPHCPPRTRAILGRALLLAHQPEEAMRELRLCAAHLPDYAPCARSIVVAAIEAGMIEDARAALQQVRRLRPQWIPDGKPIFWFLRQDADIARFRGAFETAARLEAAATSGGLMKPSVTRS